MTRNASVTGSFQWKKARVEVSEHGCFREWPEEPLLAPFHCSERAASHHGWPLQVGSGLGLPYLPSTVNLLLANCSHQLCSLSAFSFCSLTLCGI